MRSVGLSNMHLKHPLQCRMLHFISSKRLIRAPRPAAAVNASFNNLLHFPLSRGLPKNPRIFMAFFALNLIVWCYPVGATGRSLLPLEIERTCHARESRNPLAWFVLRTFTKPAQPDQPGCTILFYLRQRQWHRPSLTHTRDMKLPAPRRRSPLPHRCARSADSRANSGNADFTPPPAPQHHENSRIRSISTKLNSRQSLENISGRIIDTAAHRNCARGADRKAPTCVLSPSQRFCFSPPLPAVTGVMPGNLHGNLLL